MKTLSQIIALSSLLSLAAAATPPTGFIVSYTGPDCAQAAGVTQGLDTNIAQNACVDLPRFTSYQAGVGVACPTGTTPKLTLYTEGACGGTAVDAGTLPQTGIESPCKEISVMISSTVSVGGQSAEFTCV